MTTVQEQEQALLSACAHPGGQAAFQGATVAAFRTAVEEHQAGRLTTAARLYRLIVCLWPEVWQARRNLDILIPAAREAAERHRRENRPDEAADCARLVLRSRPDDIGMLELLSRVERRPGRFASALAAADRAVRLVRSPASSRPRVLLYQHGGTDIWANLTCAFAEADCDVVLISDVGQIPPFAFDLVVSNHVVAEELLAAGPVFRAFTLIQWTSVFADYSVVERLAPAFAPGSGRRLFLWVLDEDMHDFTARHRDRLCPEAVPFYCPLPIDAERAGYVPAGEFYTREDLARKTATVERCLPLIDVFDATAHSRLFVYAGQYFPMPRKPEDTDLPWDIPASFHDVVADGEACFAADNAFGMVPFVERCADRWNISVGRDTVGTLRHFYITYRQIICANTRGVFNRTMKERFRDDFLLFGPHWPPLGLKAEPANANVAGLYRHMRGCLDYGSLGMDTAWFMRVIEIVKYGGNLLQFRKAHSHEHYEHFTDRVTFRDAADLVAKAEHLATSGDLSWYGDFRSFLTRKYGPAAIGRRLRSILLEA